MDEVAERIPAERFEGNLEAYLYYLLSLPTEETVAAMLDAWRGGRWREDPHVFLNRLWVASERGSASLSKDVCGRIWLDALRELPWETARRTVFRNAFLLWSQCTLELVDEACRWLAEVAEPSDADILVDGLGQLLRHRGEAAVALLDWTMAKGVSAFRNPAFVEPLGDAFLLLAHRDGRQADARLLLALLATVDHGLSPARSGALRDDETFWRAVQACEADAALVANVLAKLLAGDGARRALFVLERPDVCPGVWEVSLGLLGGGEVPPSAMPRWWEAAFRARAPDEPVALRDPAAIEAGLKALSTPFDHNDKSARWAALLARAWWQTIASDASMTSRPFAPQSLRLLAGHELTSQGVRDALTIWLRDRNDDSSRLAQDLLAEPHPSRIKASLLAAASSYERETRALSNDEDVSLDALRARIAAVVLRPLGATAYGVDVDTLLATCTRLELTPLDKDDKVRIVGDALLVDDGYPTLLADRGLRGRELVQLAALYVMHELMHVGQGVGNYALVGALRGAGGETTLLHIDLGADHAAAVALHRAVPSWSMAELKATITRSLVFFPASGLRTAASRTRKSLRAVASMLDTMLHERGVGLDASGGGYWYVDFSPLGGDAFAVAAGPPVHLVAKERVTAQEAEALLLASVGAEAMELARPIVERLAARVVEARRAASR